MELTISEVGTMIGFGKSFLCQLVLFFVGTTIKEGVMNLNVGLFQKFVLEKSAKNMPFIGKNGYVKKLITDTSK